MILDINGRKIKISTGKKSQSINICNEANKLGMYEKIYRITLYDNFLKEEDLYYIKKIRSMAEFSNFLIQKGALIERTKNGKINVTSSKVDMRPARLARKQRSSLATALEDHKNKISKYLYVGKAKWDGLLKRISNQESNSKRDFDDEQIWTFLVSCGYAISGENGVSKINKILNNVNQRHQGHQKIWFETLPVPPASRREIPT